MLNKKKPFQQAMSALFCALLLIPNLSLAFSDVPKDHEHIDAIQAMETQGIIKGYPDGTFKPDKFVSRAEFIKMAFNHIGYKPMEKLYPTGYTDVDPGSWYAAYVKKALDLELIHLNPTVALFLPAEPISRIEALKILMPLEGVPTPFTDDKNPLLFEDIEADAPYRHIVEAAQNTGIFIAEEQPYFFPLRNLTRADAAELLYRAQIYREAQGTGLILPNIDIEDEFGGLSDMQTELINNPKFPVFLNVWSKINEQYLHKDKIDQNKLVYGAISGMVDSLDDPYSTFEGPETGGDLQDDLEGNYEGIGTVLDNFENQYIIIGIISDSPAEKAGLKVGDIIKKIDGKVVDGVEVNKLIDSIKGPSGTSVDLTVDRDGKTMTFTVTREEITLESVIIKSNSTTQIPDTLGYIAIYQFIGSTGADFDDTLSGTMAKNPKGIILDLRDNPGGYVEAAYEVLEHFVPKGKTLAEMKVSGKTIDELSQSESTVDVPIVILVNDGTASASEIVAGALQDHGLAKLIGEQTYGKGTVQEVTVFTDGSFFKLSIAQWMTPDGHDINKIGLTPDILVKQTKDDILGKTDSQLQRAIDELSKSK